MLQKIAETKSTRPYPRVFWLPAFSKTFRLAWGQKENARNLPHAIFSSWFGCLGFEKGQGWFFRPEKIVEEEVELLSLISHPLPALVKRTDTPTFVQWKQNVEIALEQIEKGVLKKVVLARSTVLQLDKAVSPWDILAKLHESRHPSTTLFLVQRSPATAFVGATPEKLYERDRNQISTMALAGTCKRGTNPVEDRIAKQGLLDSEKDRREVEIVQKELKAALQTLCETLKADEEPSILETRNLYHLHYALKGHLRPDIADRHLLQLLHPTPALGGSPRGAALRLIQTLEPFKRGWYGAPLGWFSEEASDVAIGIRSALVQNNKVHLFAGAGIVQGSDPAKEWEELENKIAGFIRLWQ